MQPNVEFCCLSLYIISSFRITVSGKTEKSEYARTCMIPRSLIVQRILLPSPPSCKVQNNKKSTPIFLLLFAGFRCKVAEKAGFKLCQPDSKCLDFESSITCHCPEGFVGSGLIPGACEKIPGEISLV